jgi:hypothetical protein
MEIGEAQTAHERRPSSDIVLCVIPSVANDVSQEHAPNLSRLDGCGSFGFCSRATPQRLLTHCLLPAPPPARPASEVECRAIPAE